jgi:hypothetical protein
MYCENDECDFIGIKNIDLQFYNSNREDLEDLECVKYLCKRCFNKYNTADIYMYEKLNIKIKNLIWIDK